MAMKLSGRHRHCFREWADAQTQGLAGQSRGIGDLPQSLRLSLLRITIDLAAAC